MNSMAALPLATGHSGESREDGQLHVGDVLHQAVSTLRARYWRLLGATLPYELTALLVLALGSVCGAFIPLLPLLPYVGLSPVGESLGHVYVRATRGEHVRKGAMWEGLGARYGTVLCVRLVRWLIYLGAVVPAVFGGIIGDMADRSSAPWAPAGVTLGALLIAGSPILLLFLASRLWFAGLVVLDVPRGHPGAKVRRALATSWERTAPCTGRLMLLVLLTVVVSAMGFVFLAVGYVLVGVPFRRAVTGAAFDRLFPRGYTGFCERCGYDIRATVRSVGYRCPECGHQNMAPARG